MAESQGQGEPASGAEPTATYNVPDISGTTTPKVQEKREDIRGLLAGGLAVLFAVTVVAGFVAAMVGGEAWTNARDFLQVVLPAIIGVFGSAVGFYFGSQRQ